MKPIIAFAAAAALILSSCSAGGSTGPERLEAQLTESGHFTLTTSEASSAPSSAVREESAPAEEPLPSEPEAAFFPNQYGDGFSLDFCGGEIVGAEGSGVDPNREMNMILNQMLFTIQHRAGVIPADAGFLEPELLSADSRVGGDPTSVNYPDMKFFTFCYRLPVDSGGSFELTVELSTWIDGEVCRYDGLNGLLISIRSPFDDRVYRAYGPGEMSVFEAGNEDRSIDSWSLSEGMYTETETPQADPAPAPPAEETSPVSDALQSDLNLLSGYGFSPYESEGVWYCDIGCGTLHYETGMWVDSQSQIRLEPHWEGEISGMVSGELLLSSTIYSTNLIFFGDYSGNLYSLSRAGLQKLED